MISWNKDRKKAEGAVIHEGEEGLDLLGRGVGLLVAVVPLLLAVEDHEIRQLIDAKLAIEKLNQNITMQKGGTK